LNIILVSKRFSKARTITVDAKHIACVAAAVAFAIIAIAGALNFVMLRFASDLQFVPFLRTQVLSIAETQQRQNESYMQDNLNAMAKRLGEMQAQLLRLDTLGERLAKLAGFKPQEFQFNEVPGRGGAPSTVPVRDFSLVDLTRQVDLLSRKVEDRGDKLGALESLFTLENAKKKLIPTMLPVIGGGYSSNFGWRIDPFTGQHSHHEGIDFAGSEGAPILAAAGGIVVYAEHHPQYGNMVEIDHGNDLVTRYAHASRLQVKVGDMVLRGAKIAEVGSTGRSTGAHLHFEVRQRGVAVNPTQFLQLPG
jgi:murein DD-endopeptidase MepM/ murein hydrolase activator NlpD